MHNPHSQKHSMWTVKITSDKYNEQDSLLYSGTSEPVRDLYSQGIYALCAQK